jgi:hypothetical protein
LAALLWALLSATGSVARADDVYDPDVTREARLARRGPVNLLPDTVAARVTDDRATATTWAGYDGAMHAPLLTATVEARIAGRLALVAGGGYTAEAPGALALRPRLGLRAQLLDQARSGVDGGLAVTYRQDRFTVEGGFLQAAVAVGRRQGPVQFLGNLVYGIDPAEGDDHEGELRLACLLEARPGLLVGVDGRYSHDLWSTDPNRAARDRPTSALVAGPTASYAIGSWAVMVETGFSTVRTTTTQNGLVAQAGMAASF